jgi:hypothetical protein
MNVIKLRYTLPIVFICMELTPFLRADSLALRNYDKDPNLAKAMEYDITETTDPIMANREKAEKYYLEYLKRDLPSFQKARIYFKLGNLYTVASDPRQGIKPDYEKGQTYLGKVLEFEPERIDLVTIGARTLMSSSPIIPNAERIKKRLETYKWLSSIDENMIKQKWLPLRPDQNEVFPLNLQQLKNLVPGLKHSEALNIINSAQFQSNKEEVLLGIIKQFPGDEIADLAREQIKLPADKAAEDILKYLSTTTMNNTTGKENVSNHDNLNSESSGTIGEHKISEGNSSLLADTVQSNEEIRSHWLVYSIIICVLLMGSALFYILRIKKKHI